MPLQTETFIGKQIAPYIADIAALRIEVFREFPYLYDGSFEYEKDYLSTYIESDRAIAVLIFDHTQVVGVSTGVPIEDEMEEIKKPLLDANYDIGSLFYCGESILQKEYRGRGIYQLFFRARENYAKRLGNFKQISFCSVVRPSDHPLRPYNYSPLNPVWKKFGYEKKSGLITSLSWKDIHQPKETQKQMQYWFKNI